MGNRPFLTDLTIPPNQLLLNNGNATFQEVEGALPEEFLVITWNIAVADVNNDGFIDIIRRKQSYYDSQELNQLMEAFKKLKMPSLTVNMMLKQWLLSRM